MSPQACAHDAAGAALPPVFLVGAGRSGTTLLYKLLAAHRAVGYLGNYQKRLPHWRWTPLLHRLPACVPALKRRFWFDDEGGAYFNQRRRWLLNLVPSPSEAEPLYAAAGMLLTPAPEWRPDEATARRLRQAFERVRRLSGTRLVLSKRTANNRRLPALQAVFPQARYIHLLRDGRAVAYSLLKVHWWDDHVLYWNGRTPRQLVDGGADPVELAARNWTEEMASIEQGLRDIPPAQVLQVHYESLLAQPRRELQRMLDFMGLGGEEDPAFWRTVESLRLRPRPEAWQTRWSEAERQRVAAIQAAMLRRWGLAAEGAR